MGEGGRRSALKVIGERRYIDYSDDKSLSHANLSQALASLKSLKPAGPRDELDLDATIHESARNGGEIELVFRRALLDRIEVVLLIDNGGSSMIPHVALTRLLFAKVRDRFKRHDTYFFHNTIYGTVYKDAQRRLPLPVEKLLQRSPETRLLILGDASMAPEELLYPGGAITWGVHDAEPSLRWLERLRDRFRHSAWLNPIPKESWPEAYGRTTIKRIGRGLPHGGPHPGRDQAGGGVAEPAVGVIAGSPCRPSISTFLRTIENLPSVERRRASLAHPVLPTGVCSSIRKERPRRAPRCAPASSWKPWKPHAFSRFRRQAPPPAGPASPLPRQCRSRHAP